MMLSSGTGGIYFNVGGTNEWNIDAEALRPWTDNANDLGGASNRVREIFAANGTINTSDAREKQDVRDLESAERAVALRLRALLRAFRWKDAVAAKGDGARIHFGVIAQEVADAFRAEGLDPHRYALFCHDSWEAIPAELDDDGNVVRPEIPAGDRHGIRYEELMAFMLAAS